MRARLFSLIFLVASPALALAQTPAPFAVKNGDRVVFYGDSITDQRLYTTFVETYVLTRFPGMTVDFVHSGWGGDRVGGGGGGKIDTRLARDVVAYKPTVVTIMLGMNDASYRAFDEEIFETYAKGYKHIVAKLKHDLPGVRLTLIQPSPFDDVCHPPLFPGGYNAVLVKYGAFVKTLAEEIGATVADLNGPVVEAVKKAHAADPIHALKLNPDRIHPASSGQLLMAAALLKAWNAPALVSSVEINVAGDAPKVVSASNAAVKSLASSAGSVAWTQLDSALPFPIDFKDTATKLAVASSTILQDLDQQTLKVTGLPQAKYSLLIDGKEVATFSKEELAKGVNLATLATPMVEQAALVHSLTLKHNTLHFFRWRSVQVPMAHESEPDLQKALEGFDGMEAKIIDHQRSAAKPKPHDFVLKPKA